MKMRWATLAVAGLLPVLAGQARGQDPAELFSKLDVNNDGQVTAEEVPDAQKGLFERLVRRSDANGDKQLSKGEFAAGFRPDASVDRQPGGPGAGPFGRPGGPPPGREFFERQFGELDRNSDGKLTLDEVPEERRGMRMMFERAREGASGENSLTKEQFARAMAAMAQAGPPERRGGDGPPRTEGDQPRRGDGPPREGRPGDGRFGEGRLNEARRPDGPPGPRPDGPPGMRPGGPGGGLFAALDANRDGELSNAEIVGAGVALLKLDRNSDGKITPDEAFSAQGPFAGPGPFAGRPGDAPGGERRPGQRGQRDGERGPGERGPGDRGQGERGPRDGERRPPDGRPGAGRTNLGPEDFRNGMMRQTDTNRDGKISKEEAPARLKDNFDRYDHNGDGFIDEAEFLQMFERLREGGGRGEGRPPVEGAPDEGARQN